MKLIVKISFSTAMLLLSGCAPWLWGMSEEEWEKRIEIRDREDAEWNRMSAYDRNAMREREEMSGTGR